MKTSSIQSTLSDKLLPHRVHDIITDAHDPISVLLVGAGGTGSLILSSLARMNGTLQAVFQKQLMVTVMDNDTVSEANVGRQLFSPADIGLLKSSVLVSRINQFFGYNWYADAGRLTRDNTSIGFSFNIIITATDNVESRKITEERFYQKIDVRNNFVRPIYWLDCGNGKDFGNVFLSDQLHTLPNAFDLKMTMNEEDSGPSCSLAESIGKQDMFVNSWVALMASQLLWELFTKPEIHWHAGFFNLANMAFTKRKIIKHEGSTRSKRKPKSVA